MNDPHARLSLPLLDKRTPELESCTFCPKLSRAACPVSSADGRETTTPWGKMTAAYLVARGAVEATKEQAWPPWACTGCFACRQSCDLRNDVAGTLLDARADFMSNGLAPEEAKRLVARHAEKTRASDVGLASAVERARARGAQASLDVGSKTRVVVGCLSARRGVDATTGDDVAADAIVATSALVGGACSVAPGCCGVPLRMAGDRDGFVAAARAFVASLSGVETLVVVDSGCLHGIARRYREVGVELPRGVEVVHLSELAARALPRLSPSKEPLGEVRYHDACALGRGMDVYQPPRAVLSRILGGAPSEFARRREGATCSGGGGAMPSTYGDNARAIAEARIDQHRELGGGAIATTCASSRAMLGKGGTRVYDLATLIARALQR